MAVAKQWRIILWLAEVAAQCSAEVHHAQNMGGARTDDKELRKQIEVMAATISKLKEVRDELVDELGKANRTMEERELVHTEQLSALQQQFDLHSTDQRSCWLGDLSKVTMNKKIASNK